MTVAVTAPSAFPPLVLRRPQWFLIALHVPLLMLPAALTITGLDGRPRQSAAIVVPLTLAIGALQLRHSLAAARDERPAGWIWSYLALTALVYVPLYWFSWNWATMQMMVIASGAMVLRGWPAKLAVAAPLVGTALVAGVTTVTTYHMTIAQGILQGFWWFSHPVVASLALYGSARFVRVVEELSETRSELAELAVGRERLRVSRDLHDLVGQSLSAVSLKGDLAMRLLPADAVAARAEIDGLTGVARDALRGVQAVARDEHTTSLRREIDAAAALLDAAGIEARIDVDLAGVTHPVEEVMAWAVREGTTNTLRHSAARTCSIRGGRVEGTARLEIVNDGVADPMGEGRGLAGLAERADALSGSVSAERTPDGRFRLRVEIPCTGGYPGPRRG